MPIDIRDIDGGRGVRIRGFGVITDDEYLESMKQHLEQDRDSFINYRYSYSDYSEAESVEVTLESIKQIAHLCKVATVYNPHAVVAVLTTEGHAYNLARAWESNLLASDWDTMIFTDKEQAESWLRNTVMERHGFVPPI